MSSISLKNLLVSSKTVDVEYPGMPGFSIKVCFLSRELLVNIRKKSTKTTFKNRQTSEELDDDLFLKLYVEAAVKGWTGFKLSYVEELCPVDLSGQNPEDLLEFTEENALFLMKNSVNFDSFISETVTDLGNFQTSSIKK